MSVTKRALCTKTFVDNYNKITIEAGTEVEIHNHPSSGSISACKGEDNFTVAAYKFSDHFRYI